jgi:hypothetical protein
MQISEALSRLLEELSKEIYSALIPNDVSCSDTFSLKESRATIFYRTIGIERKHVLVFTKTISIYPSGTINIHLSIAGDGKKNRGIAEVFKVSIDPGLQVTFSFADGSQTFSLHVRSDTSLTKEQLIRRLQTIKEYI